MIAKNNIAIEDILESMNSICKEFNNLNITHTNCAPILKYMDLSLQDTCRYIMKIQNELRTLNKHLLIAALLINTPENPDELLNKYADIIDTFIKQQSDRYNAKMYGDVHFC